MAKKTASRSRALVPFRMTAPRPIVVRQTRVVHAKRKHGKRHHHHAGLGGFVSPERIGIGLGAYALGFISKQKWDLPKLPVLGETGTIALAAHFLSDGGKNKLAADIATAAIAIAGYTLATTGAIVGIDGAEPDMVSGF